VWRAFQSPTTAIVGPLLTSCVQMSQSRSCLTHLEGPTSKQLHAIGETCLKQFKLSFLEFGRKYRFRCGLALPHVKRTVDMLALEERYRARGAVLRAAYYSTITLWFSWFSTAEPAFPCRGAELADLCRLSRPNPEQEKARSDLGGIHRHGLPERNPGLNEAVR
jgi:hypothetical protein